jgi:uncharacterized protein YcbX
MKATVTELNLYPVKGCRGIGLRSARLAATGLEVDGIGDREWLVVDAAGRFVSQREHPRMALVETRFAGAALRLRAPGMLGLEVPFASEGDVIEVQVWDDRVAAVTQGEIADAWFSNFLGAPARLVRFDPEARRIASRSYTGSVEAPYKFADAFPLLIVGQASLADLNARLAQQGERAVTLARFRPNIVLGGLAAYEEDFVETLRCTDLVLRPVKPCARCTVPGVDPLTGETSTTVPDLLATYRGKPNGVMFGVNAIVVDGAGGELAVGDEFEVELRF